MRNARVPTLLNTHGREITLLTLKILKCLILKGFFPYSQDTRIMAGIALINHVDKNSRPRPINTPFFQKKKTQSIHCKKIYCSLFLQFHCIILYFHLFLYIFGSIRQKFLQFYSSAIASRLQYERQKLSFQYIFSSGLASSRLKLF